MYWEQGMSLPEIGEATGRSAASVRDEMVREGISTRAPGEGKRKGGRKLKYNLSPELLHREYWENGKSLTEIGEMLGISFSAVANEMNRLGIPRRTIRAAKHKEIDPVALSEAYAAGASLAALSREHGVRSETIGALLRSQGVEIRSQAEGSRVAAARRRASTPERRRISTALRRRIKTECAICGTTDGLELHHLNADRSDNAPANLIALCAAHHSAVEWFIRKATPGILARAGK